MAKSETVRILDQLTLEEREAKLNIAQANLLTMHQIYEDNKHLTDTTTIEKIVDKLAASMSRKGHVCFQGERLARIEEKLDNIATVQTEVKEALEVSEKKAADVAEKLFAGYNANHNRITVLETKDSALAEHTAVSGNKVALWIAAISALISLLTMFVMIYTVKVEQRDAKKISDHSTKLDTTLVSARRLDNTP
jgi:hypothetical protein